MEGASEPRRRFLCTPGIRWWYVFVSPYSLHLRHLRSTKRTIFQKSWNSLLEFPTTQLWFSTIVLRLLRYKVFVWPNCELQNEFMLCPTDPDVDAQKSFVWGDLEADLFSPIFFSYHLTASTTTLKYKTKVHVRWLIYMNRWQKNPRFLILCSFHPISGHFRPF